LNLTDTKRAKGLGVVGARFVGATGLQVMSALAISPGGVPLGLCGQKYWARTKRTTRAKAHDRRPVEERETGNWLEVMRQVRESLAAEAPRTKPWFQLDRAGDAWPVLLDGLNGSDLCTIRATYNRRLTAES